ncbi:hypothetical protein HDU98_006244 [Podochytrium sp. JEL0797]|nr:hypothetical protein HDU98_006244 [Podochytrium sp. JEL0797]
MAGPPAVRAARKEREQKRNASKGPSKEAKKNTATQHGGRNRRAVEADLEKGRLIAQLAKAKRDKHRAVAAKEKAEAAKSNNQKKKEEKGGVKEEKEVMPAELIDEEEVKAKIRELQKPKERVKGGEGKKGKAFASETDMLSIINDINESEEVKIEKKLVKRRAVHIMINQQEKAQRTKENDKKRALEAKKKEILDAQKAKTKKRKPKQDEDEEEKPQKKRVTFGGKKDANLMQLSSGSLHKVTSSPTATAKNPVKRLLYKDATLTVRRTERDFNYQLVATRLFEEGEEEAEEELDLDNLNLEDIDSETAFLLDESIHLLVKDNVVSWSDPLVPGVVYLFEVEDTPEATLVAFEGVAYTSMYERRAKKSHTEAAEEELDAYFTFVRAAATNAHSPKAPEKKKLVAKPSPVAKSQAEAAPMTTPKKVSAKAAEAMQTPVNKNVGTPMSMGSTPLAINNTLAPEGETVEEVQGDLYLYDRTKTQFNLMRPSITARLVRISKFAFHLTISDAAGTHISQPLDNTMNPQFNAAECCFVWLWKDDASPDVVYPWSIKFVDSDAERVFRDAFGACMYEVGNQSAFAKVKEEDRGYLVNAYQEDVEMGDIEEEEEEEEEEEVVEESEEEGGFEDAEDNSAPGDKSAKISNLTVGHGDRSYFVRGSQIGVLGHPDADSMEYSTMINRVQTPGGVQFTPSKVLLHDQDRSMILMKPNEEHVVYRMDLERGQVVEEWKIDEVTPVTEILPEAKNANMTPSRNLIGINHNSIFRLDPRLESKLVRSESKTYASNVGQFNCATTTANGMLAVGSSKGDIRLYNKLNVRAKTHLPGLGDPYTGIDTTESGKWVVGTCKTYLMVVCTEARDTKAQATRGATFSGFEKSLGDQKPIPIRLQLRAEHVAYMGGSVSFTPARFNTSGGSGSAGFEETSIVTSTGPFVVTWNFRRVKQGKLNDYTIKQYGQDIVADNFKFGGDKNIIVALPEDVHMVSSKQLQTPAKMLRSRSSIVNSPF